MNVKTTFNSVGIAGGTKIIFVGGEEEEGFGKVVTGYKPDEVVLVEGEGMEVLRVGRFEDAVGGRKVLVVGGESFGDGRVRRAGRKDGGLS